jgi:hypothetical protein
MNKYLANGLRPEPDDWVYDIFYEGFQTAAEWIGYLRDHFPEGVGSILNKERGWSAEEFQALYIACWAYKPVVKGSYLIRLSDDHLPYVKHGYEKMPSRWTSHLHKKLDGRSVSEDWRFLRGYHELLAQMEERQEGQYLFLKCEGHVSTHPSHIKSYFHKKKHGVGLDVNEELLTLASNEDLHLGIKVRRAENYSSTYKDLLKTTRHKSTIKKQGEVIDIREAAGVFVVEMLDSTKKMGLDDLTTWLKSNLQPFVYPLDGTRIQRFGLSHLDNSTMAHLLDVIIRFADKAQRRLGFRIVQYPFVAALYAARADLQSIQRELIKDQDRGNTHTSRLFEEVNVTPEWLDYGIDKALRLLALPKE